MNIINDPANETGSPLWQAWTIGSLGLWLVFVAFCELPRWDRMVTGCSIGVGAVVIGWLMKIERPWQGRSSAAVGAWLLLSLPFVELFSVSAGQWNHVVSGTVLAVAGFTALGGKPRTSLHHQR